jgi:hypothetical protein
VQIEREITERVGVPLYWCREIMDTMFKPEKYPPVYFSAFLYVFTITMPHSISVNLAFGNNVLKNGVGLSHEFLSMGHEFCSGNRPAIVWETLGQRKMEITGKGKEG